MKTVRESTIFVPRVSVAPAKEPEPIVEVKEKTDLEEKASKMTSEEIDKSIDELIVNI